MKYYVPEHGEGPKDAEEVTEEMYGDPLHDHFTAEAIAEWGHHYRDWWEASWPITICLIDEEDGGTVSAWSVTRVDVPEFEAIKVKT